jgi:hypothetical protein
MTGTPRQQLLTVLVALLAAFAFAVTAAADESPPGQDPTCFAVDPLLAWDAGCDGVAAPVQAVAQKEAASEPQSLPPNCRLHAEVAFWTASDWLLLANALNADASPCADYYVSIPPLAADKKGFRVLQDDFMRAIGPRIHPLAEMTLGGNTGWAKSWVTGAPGRTWFDAGVEFRKRMADAGYGSVDGETWLLNEFDQSTARDEPPYPRTAMRELLRGLYDAGGTRPPMPGLVEIGIAYTHQDIPFIAQYKVDTKAWLEDTAFWQDVAPKIRFLVKETYPDAHYWAVAGSSRHERTDHLSQYMFHFLELARAGPPQLDGMREFLSRAYMPFGSATWAARGPIDPCVPNPPYSCGHGWTMIPLDEMLHFVSEEIYTIRHYAGSHPQGAPEGRLGFSWQPTNNFSLPNADWEAAKQAIAARLAAAIHYGYRQGGASPEGACSPPDSGVDWCTGGTVPDAAFIDNWQMFESWN